MDVYTMLEENLNDAQRALLWDTDDTCEATETLLTTDALKDMLERWKMDIAVALQATPGMKDGLRFYLENLTNNLYTRDMHSVLWECGWLID